MRRASLRVWVALAAMGLAGASGEDPAPPVPGDPPPARGSVDPATGAVRLPRLSRSERIGVTHMAPRYKPNGRLTPEILFEGAEDARRLGFRTLKVGLNGEVVSPGWMYYSIPIETLRQVKTIEELARLDVFRRTFDLPFRTFIIAADALGEGNWEALRTRSTSPGAPRPADVPLSDRARANIYRQIRDLSAHLLTTYRGTGKVFILQNHETDWHTIPEDDERLDPSDVALRNAVDYFNLRQKAVDDARLEAGATGVYLYHMAEVAFVLKSMRGGRTVTNNVLPAIRPDLVGYSAWEVTSTPGAPFLEALRFLRSKANDSFAFGDDNVVISEMGAKENLPNTTIEPQVRSLLEALTDRVPWVIQWNLYDNECFDDSSGKRENKSNARIEDCLGNWVRRPDGRLGRLFTAYRPYLIPGEPLAEEPADSGAYVDRLYLTVMGRRADPAGRAAAAATLDARPWDKEDLFRDLIVSDEYRARTAGSPACLAFDAYRTLFGRDPEPAALAALEQPLRTDAERLSYVARLTDTPESRRRYADWLCRRHLGEPPAPGTLDALADGVARAGSRERYYRDFARRVARP